MGAKGNTIVRRDKEGEGYHAELLTMALGIVVERVGRLSEDDKADLFELVEGLMAAKSQEEVGAIFVAMKEILAQYPGRVSPMPPPPDATPERLKKWMTYLGGRVKELRKAAGLTQEELAEKTGLPQSHISRIENAELSPTNMTLQKIAKALGRRLSDLDPSV